TCVFAARVLKIPLCGYYNVLKFIRRRGSAFANDELKLQDPADVWPSINKLWHDLVQRLQKNRPIQHGKSHPEHEPITIVSDASITGYGAALFYRGRVYTTAGKWPHDRFICDDINELEMRAVEEATTAFKDIIHDIIHQSEIAPSVVILVDNSSTMHVLRKGHAREFAFNEATSRVLSGLAGLGDVFCGWISTHINPVDPLSRGLPPPENLRSALGALGRRLPPLRRCCVGGGVV
ncbi:MAG: hypothetical protein NTV12_06830, partial [Verrucomicrobia bacterium]|nr:hypothetical protein [Verrucomicrobiota bacterium]